MTADKYKVAQLLIYLLPIGLIAGPLIAELVILLLMIFAIQNNLFNFKLLKKDFFFIFIIIFYLYLNFTNINSSNLLLSFKSSFTYIRIPLYSYAVYLLIQNGFIDLEKLYKFFGYLLLIICIDSIFQFFFGFNIFGIEKFHDTRISSFFGDELILGSFVIKIFPLFVALFFAAKKNNHSNFVFIFIVSFASLVSILLSNERTAFFLYLIFVSFLFLYLIKIKQFKFIIIFLSFVMILSSIFFHYNKDYYYRLITSTYNNIFGAKDRIIIFTNDHQSHYETAIKMFKDKIFIGHGVKQFRVKCKEKKYYVNEVSCSTHPHNFYIQMLAETGMIGFIFLIAFISYILILMLKSFLLIKINSIDLHNYSAFFFLNISIFLNLFPISPHGNFFNNWISITIYLPIGFWLYYKNKIN